MLFQINNGTVSVGGQRILSHIDFSVKGKEKVAVVGRNGSGKTTLLKVIMGQLDLDRDDKRQGPGISKSRDVSIAMMSQTAEGDMDKTLDELISLAVNNKCNEENKENKDNRENKENDAEYISFQVEYDKLLTGFGFDKSVKGKMLSDFSGGEQTKLSLIRYLLMKPDILLLDEPTNHLDIQTVEWLEAYLRDYDRAVIIVSHDRFFLDRVVDVVYEISNEKIKRYPGNYTHFKKQKQKDYELQLKAYESQQAEIAKLNELIKKFKNKPTKAGFARSRKTMLDRMEIIPKPEAGEGYIFTGDIVPEILGSKWVLEADHLKIGYDKVLLEISLRLKRGQKIAIIGSNGAGKSTFLKTVAGFIEPLDGSYSIGNTILMGYFDQQSAINDSDKQVLEHFHNLFPAMLEKDARRTLGAYLFKGEDAHKQVKSLSGGEKARLLLCELMTSRPNFLVLDEPTNHMDIQAKETLESAFKAYKGSMLFVSHDRYLVSQVADAILVFEEDQVMYYPFGYDHYIERKNKGSQQGLAAMISAEDQAMVAGLKAVPKPERHRLREIGTETAHMDWQFRLASEPLAKVEEKLALVESEFDNLQTLEDYENWLQRVDQANEYWTEACIKWYDSVSVFIEDGIWD